MSLNNVYKWKNASTVKAQNITAMLQHELSRKKDRYVERLWRSASAAECLNFYTVLAQICVAVLKELNQKHKNQRFNYTFNGPTQYRTTKQCQVAMVTKTKKSIHYRNHLGHLACHALTFLPVPLTRHTHFSDRSAFHLNTVHKTAHIKQPQSNCLRNITRCNIKHANRTTQLLQCDHIHEDNYQLTSPLRSYSWCC